MFALLSDVRWTGVIRRPVMYDKVCCLASTPQDWTGRKLVQKYTFLGLALRFAMQKG